MSAYKARHLKADDSFGAQIKEAGRKVLYSSLSIVLASSLIPVTPQLVYAEESPSPTQESSPTDGPAPAEGGEGEQETPGETPEGDQGSPTVGEEASGADEGEQQDEGPSQEASQPTSQPAQGDEDKQQQEPAAPAQPTSNDADGQKANAAAQTTTTKDAKEPDAKKDDDQGWKAQSGEVEEPTLTASARPNAIDGEYCYDINVTVEVAGESLSADDVAKAVVSYERNGVEGSQEQVLDLSDTSGKAEILLEDAGIYTNIKATVTGVRYGEGDGQQSFEPDDISISGTYVVVDDVAPNIQTVTLLDAGQAAYHQDGASEAYDLLKDGGVVVDVDSAQTIQVTVTDDALNTNDDNSYVRATNEKGEEKAKVAFEKGDTSDGITTYTAKLDGLTGRLALDVVAQGFGVNKPTEAKLAGTDDNGTLKANGSFVIDDAAPTVAAVKAGDVEVPPTSELQTVMTNATAVTVEVSDAMLNTDVAASYVRLLDSDDAHVGEDAAFAYDEQDHCYRASVDISSCTDGTYSLQVVAADQIHDPVSQDYGKVSIDREAPSITSAKLVGGGEDVTLGDGVSTQNNKLVIEVSGDDLDADASYVKVTPQGSTEGTKATLSDGAYELADIAEGIYTITVYLVDAAGNEKEASYNTVSIDSEGPQIQDFAYEDAVSYLPDGESDPVCVIRPNKTVTISAKDLSFDAGKMEVAITRNGEDVGATGLTWTSSGEGSSVYTTTFAPTEDGPYQITVSGKDAYDHQGVAHTETFYVSAVPQVTATLTSGQDIATTNVEATDQYFKTPVIFDVTIVGTNIDEKSTIDETSTTIAGVALSSIDEGTNGTLQFSAPIEESTSGTYTYRVTVTYNEGLHEADANPVVSAKDWYLAAQENAQPVTTGTYQKFIVDTKAPNLLYRAKGTDEQTSFAGVEGDQTIFFEYGNCVYALADDGLAGIADVTLACGDVDKGSVFENGTISIPSEATDEDTDVVLTTVDKAGNESKWLLQTTAGKTNTDNTGFDGTSYPILLEADTTAPVLELSGAEAAEYYKAGDDGKTPAITLKVTEANFEALQQYAGSQKMLRIYRRDNTAGSEYGSEPHLTKTIGEAAKDDLEEFYTVTTDALSDGHYRVEAAITDLAGNSGSAFIDEFTVDTTPPIIESSYAPEEAGTCYKVDDDHPNTVTLTITEHNLETETIDGTVTIKNGVVTVKDNDNVRNDLVWIQGENDTYTCTVDLADGSHALSIESTDLAGNLGTKEVKQFYVDSVAPTVTLTYPDEQQPVKTAENRDFFDRSPVTVNIAISDANLDTQNTTVDGYAIQDLMDPSFEQPSGVTYAIAGSDGTHTGTITYTAEGEYTPVIVAKDVAEYEAEESKTIVVDATAPAIAAYIDHTPFELGEGVFWMQRGNDRYVFFKTGEEAAIHFSVTEPHGIQSIELTDADGYELVTEDGEDPKSVIGQFGTSPLVFKVVKLEDGHDFSDQIKVKVTDYAGNYRIWSMNRLGGKCRQGGSTAEVNESPAALFYTELTGSSLKHPKLLIEDDTAPVLTLSESGDPATLADNTPSYPRYFNKDHAISLDVTERNLKYLRGWDGVEGVDPNRVVLTVLCKKNEAGAKATTVTVPVKDLAEVDSDAGKYELAEAFGEMFKADGKHDGHYTVSAELTDIVGLSSGTKSLTEFTIDTVAPTFTVAYSGGTKAQDANGKEYYAAPRTATITVKEHNFDPKLFDVKWTFGNHADDAKAPSYSWDDSKTDTHTCTVTFPSDGEYQLTVSGKDKAGNPAVIEGTTQTTYTSPTFVIDTERPVIADVYDFGKAPKHLSDPVVEFPQPTGTYQGKNYYAHAIEVPVRVKDRNFDAATTEVYRIHNGSEAKQGVQWTLEKSRSQWGDGFEVYLTRVTYKDDGDYRTPRVHAVDFSKNASDNAPKDFVVDLAAPTISVKVNRTPTSTGKGNKKGDPIQFFNRATKMTFSMHDDHLLRSYQLDDPEGEYVVATTERKVEGRTDATLVIKLKDGTQSSNDTEYERNIKLTVEDIAGNRRMWTIDRRGQVVKDEVVSGAANASINGEDAYPTKLIQDTTAPVVKLSGVTAGTYYNTVQTVHASVNEFNFDYLKRFDGSRTIVHVDKQEGNAGRAQSSWEIPASSFSGTRPNYGFDQPFDADGHYELWAEFLDYANNRSNRAAIDEFTIDMTAPIITVEFDNNDARNGNYYKAGRTATITVVEHNFDPALIDIQTTGSIGGWSSDGDTHVCTVTFGTDGTYSLTVGGKDMAGNEANTFTEPDFVIDLTAPKVTFSGTVQRYGVDRGQTDAEGNVMLDNAYDGNLDQDGQMPDSQSGTEVLQDHHAYNGIVMPSIEFYDQAGNGATNYDANGVEFTLTGGKHGTETSDFGYIVQEGAGGQTYQFNDFGLIAEAQDEDGRSVYDPDADDVYTITAKMTDLAGNEAEGTVTFSVNRYGSNFVVTAYSLDGQTEQVITGNQDLSGIDYDLLGTAPRIEVHEINVSGSEANEDHSVLKEYANAISPIRVASDGDSRKDGYELHEDEQSEVVSDYGWSEYVYSIRQGNFGIGSPSDTGDGGQGVYRVNVASVDRASNDTSSADYLSTADYDKTTQGKSQVRANPEQAMANIAESLRNATASFTLDEIAPVIDELNVPNFLAVGQSYTATVHVTDAITRGDTVKVYVDGRELEEGEFDQHGASDGTGTYEFKIATNYVPFATHEVRVVASDTVQGREPVELTSQRFMVSILVPEIAVIAAVLGGITAGVVFFRRRKAVAEPDKPGSYE